MSSVTQKQLTVVDKLQPFDRLLHQRKSADSNSERTATFLHDINKQNP